MNSTITRRTLLASLGVGSAVTALSACSTNTDPLSPQSEPGGNATGGATAAIVIGSQPYYSNEIIAECYAQMIEKAGMSVNREYQIGQREVYMAELENGKIDLIPEYLGNLVQYLDKGTKARTEKELYAQLETVLPKGLRALQPAAATDQDSYTVTQETARKYGLTTIADLVKLPQPIKFAANSEYTARPFGPAGLKRVYGVEVQLIPVEDSGGPLTLKALLDGTVQVANIYTADPAIKTNNLVVLQDPKDLILPQNIVPVLSDKVDEKAAAAVASVDEKLSMDALIELNTESVSKKAKSAEVAKRWLTSQGLL